MNLETILISAVASILTSVITAYFTARLKIREEKAKWSKEFKLKYAEAQITGNTNAEKIAAQFALGVVIINPETEEREKIFIPPNCRLVVGRAKDNPIVIENIRIARNHFAFSADETDVFVEEFGHLSVNPIELNGAVISGRQILQSGDVVSTADIRFHFQKF